MNIEENKRIVRDCIRVVWVERNIDALPDYWTSGCINHAMSEGINNQGLVALRTYHEQFGAALSAFSDMRIDILQQVAEADRVVTHLSTHLRHTGPFLGIDPTGRDASLLTIRIDRLEGGKIAEHWSVADMTGFMQQLQ